MKKMNNREHTIEKKIVSQPLYPANLKKIWLQATKQETWLPLISAGFVQKHTMILNNRVLVRPSVQTNERTNEQVQNQSIRQSQKAKKWADQKVRLHEAQAKTQPRLQCDHVYKTYLTHTYRTLTEHYHIAI